MTALAYVGPSSPVTAVPPLLGLKFTVTNGLMTGSFTSPGSLARKFRGVVLQKQNRGLGYFLTPVQSGAVTLIPQP